jgi:primosomal protein N' (replication factor Y)
MHVVSVIPITRGFGRETLSYFATHAFGPGTLVRVPLRGKTVFAIVVETTPLSDKKTDVRRAGFGLKKITGTGHRDFLSPSFMEAVHSAAKNTISNPGNILRALLPEYILSEETNLSKKPSIAETEKKALPEHTHERLDPEVIQATDDERLFAYRAVIRESFAKKRSVFLIMPTAFDVERAALHLSRGIPRFTIAIHGKLKKSDYISRWKEALESEHPVLIIGTGRTLSLARRDIGVIIVDRENTPAYKDLARPYLDVRTFARVLAKTCGAHLIYGDTTLRAETIYHRERGAYQTLGAVKYRVPTDNTMEVIDMSVYNKKNGGFQALSTELIAHMQKTLTHHGRVILLSLRRGLAPNTLCDDCGHLLTCTNCAQPLTLYQKSAEEGFFQCHRCESVYTADVVCPACGSWKLSTLGVGIERAAREIMEHFPEAPLLRLDSDHTKNWKEGVATAEQFEKTPGAILLGTEMLLFYIHHQVPLSAIITIDPLFSLPHFRIDERIINLLLRIRLLGTETFLVQTRQPTSPLFTYAQEGDLLSFYREEIASRKKHNYPPFSLLIKVSVAAREEVVVTQELKILKEKLLAWPTTVYPVTKSPDGKEFLGHLIIKVPPETFPNENLERELRALPPQFKINVEPEELL